MLFTNGLEMYKNELIQQLSYFPNVITYVNSLNLKKSELDQIFLDLMSKYTILINELIKLESN